MIEFLIMQLCIVASNGYDCNWQLELNQDRSIISKTMSDVKIYIVFPPFDSWTSPHYLWNGIKAAMEFI